MNYDSSAENGIFSTEAQHFILHIEMSFSILIRLNVPQVTGMAFSRVGSTVRLLRWIEVAAG